MELGEIVKKRKEVEKEAAENKSVNDKLDVLNLAAKRIQATFIGAIVSFENNFGKLWGHNEFKLTEQQKKFRNLWRKTREEILDKGNDQIEFMQSELKMYEFDKVGHYYDILINTEEE